MILGMLAFFIAQVLVWFQTNSQLIWGWWRDKPLAAALIFALPVSLLFWYGTKYIYDATEELWTVRLIGFGMSYLTFPFLTHWLLGESMFTSKTIICTLLAISILWIQISWK
jgi:ABC-type maltose transport system permease subunit